MDAPSPSATIFALTQFHTILGTVLFITSTNSFNNTDLALANTLAYIHFWCATLGFLWWYYHAATTNDQNEEQQKNPTG
ncbi:uncharacterized protein C8A04DRAFT_27343 [Dichotomopilus funicola]|uniref:Uncharacterized protein n=1 Tax=Dichotomopilus funicola TaxID=1934379 RepID=A0AAN6ZPT4_9PEZI|nr:hypothetical protein C8A04DRAFT_27343 [Dichotomopilus funicola]